MSEMNRLLQQHSEVTRRYFFGLSSAGMLAMAAPTSELEYLTQPLKMRILGRGNPAPDKLSPEQLRTAGLTPDTWFLEVVADTEGTPKPVLTQSLSRENGTALNWDALMKLASKHTVRYIHVCTCTNVADPFHTCLWEGVPLREVIWMTGPKANVRRAYYWGHTTPNSTRFQSSLSLDRILEDPPGELPVILAYKMNGQLIPGQLGGPVRLIVPGAYGNRSIKWLQQMVLTNDFRANDSYAGMNNDVESPLKTFARFINAPAEVPAATPWALTGLAQVGSSGLSQVQFCVIPEGASSAEWREATILPPPKAWGGGVDSLPPTPLQFDPSTSKPLAWPMRYAIVHWAAMALSLNAGKYTISCRTIDKNGIAQPMPRPLPRTGVNAVQRAALTVRA